MIARAMCTQMALYSLQFCLWESTICQRNSIAKEANNFTNLEHVLIVFETDPSLSKSISLSALSFNYLNNSLCLFGADYDNYLLEHFPTNYQRN